MTAAAVSGPYTPSTATGRPCDKTLLEDNDVIASIADADFLSARRRS
jgi:hypothetical protein